MGINTEARASLACKGRTGGIYYDGPAKILRSTDGIIFPLTPTIVYGQGVSYSPYELVHTNYTFYTYRNTPSPTLQLTAQFSNTTEEEHEYTLGVMHFLRSVSKMWYGARERRIPPGTPPPVLRFSAFGKRVFSNIDVLLSNFSTTFDDNVDLITGKNGDALPALMTFTLDLSIIVSPDRQKNVYSTADFIQGKLYGKGFI